MNKTKLFLATLFFFNVIAGVLHTKAADPEAAAIVWRYSEKIKELIIEHWSRNPTQPLPAPVTNQNIKEYLVNDHVAFADVLELIARPELQAINAEIVAYKTAHDNQFDLRGLNKGVDGKALNPFNPNYVAYLWGVDLSGACLDEAHLIGVDFSAANLGRIHCQRAIFNAAKLVRVNLTQAVLTESSFNGANLSDATCVETQFIKASLFKALFCRAVLNGTNLSNAVLFNADFTEASLVGSIIEGSRLEEAKFIRANLCGANVKSTFLRNADFSEANLFHATISLPLVPIIVNFEGANLASASLLTGVQNNLSMVNLKHTIMAEAVLVDIAGGETPVSAACLSHILLPVKQRASIIFTHEQLDVFIGSILKSFVNYVRHTDFEALADVVISPEEGIEYIEHAKNLGQLLNLAGHVPADLHSVCKDGITAFWQYVLPITSYDTSHGLWKINPRFLTIPASILQIFKQEFLQSEFDTEDVPFPRLRRGGSEPDLRAIFDIAAADDNYGSDSGTSST